MGQEKLMVPSCTTTEVDRSKESQKVQVYRELLECRELGRTWLRDYELPGRKLLLEILSRVYGQYVALEAMSDSERGAIYEAMRGTLRGEGIKLHADAPCAAVLLRMVFLTLDKTRVSRYARALEAVHSWRKPAGKFVEFVKEMGGIAQVPHAPMLVVVPGKPAREAVPPTAKEVSVQAPDDPDPEIGDDELEELEYGDELHAYLEAKRAAPLLTVPDPGLDATNPHRVILVGEIVNGELRVYEQAPFVEEALAKTFRHRYATCDLLRQATNAPIAVQVVELKDGDLDAA